jgi:APA family basic amino acid/polyamine antiporter
MTNASNSTAAAGRGHLLRVLGLAFGVAVVIGGTVGQGILRTPGQVAEGAQTAPLILGLWIVGGLIALIDSMSTVELAASIRQTGGPYMFLRRTFGALPGLAGGIADWLANVSSIAFVSVVFGEYLHRLGVGTSIPIGVLALGLVLTLGLIQLLGTRISGLSQEIGSAIKALLFTGLILVLLLAPRGDPVATIPAAQMAVGLTISGVIVALRGVFGTYAGWNSAAYFTEEVVNPGRAIVRATFIGIVVVTVLYTLVNVALLNVLTPAEMAGSNLVAADAAARIFGPAADPIVTAISLISLVTIINVSIMIYPRVVYAVSRDYGLTLLTRVAPNGTPRAALLVTVGAAALLASVGIYDVLIAFSTSLLATVGVAVNLAAIVLRYREPDLERPWKMPLFPLPALLALTLNSILLVAFVTEDPATTAKAFALLIGLTAVGWLATRKTHHPSRTETPDA